MLYFEAGGCKEGRERMDLERLGRGNKVRVAVGIFVVLAVVGGGYLAFAEQEPVGISNSQELQQMRENPSGNYVLVDDIDLSHIDNFEPIENFTGAFDGNGHTISNLTIDRPETDGVGLFRTVRDSTRLFGLVGDKGTVRNVRIKDANVTGFEDVGGLVGRNVRGTVTESYLQGNVSANRRVGGLVGLNTGIVTKSYTKGDVSASWGAGGLVGINRGTVVESHAEVSMTGDEWIGGLVGVNADEVRNSYATGDVAGNRGGGLVGYNIIDSTVRRSYSTGNVIGDGGGLVAGNEGEIEESYAMGSVTGENEDTGGLVGEFDGDVTDSYWDVNTTGQDNSAGGAGLTTSEMTGSAARENMEGFNFGETWRSTEDDYPRLVWQDEENDADRTAD
jgi:hypothetical protein